MPPESPPPLQLSVRLGLLAQLLALALMIGGMLALGAFTAPVVFSRLPRPAAAALMGVLFRRYDTVLLVALGLLWLGQIPLGMARLRAGWRPGSKRALAFVKFTLLLGLSGTMLYSTLVVNPKIERFQQAGIHREAGSVAGRAFDRLHQTSESLYKMDLLLALLFLSLIPFSWPWFTLQNSRQNAKAVDFGPGASAKIESYAMPLDR
jgi:Domain of unknown function (DUF4149)